MKIILSLIIMGVLLITKKSKYLSLLLIVWMIFLFVDAINIADEINYITFYNRYSEITYWDNNVEYGYQFLIKIASLLSFEYYQFKILVAGLGFGFIALSAFNKNVKSNYFLVGYFIYSFAIDAAQHRSFLAMAILIYAFSVLIFNDKKILKFIILTIFASMFHNFALFFLLFFPVKLFKPTKLILYVLIATLFLTMILNTDIPNRILSMLSISDRYLTFENFDSTNIRGFIIVFIEYTVKFILLYLTIIATKSRIINKINFTTFLNVNIISLLLLPLLALSTEFHRGIRYVLIITYLFFFYEHRFKDKSSKFAYYFLIYTSIIIIFIIKIYLPYREEIILPLFK